MAVKTKDKQAENGTATAVAVQKTEGIGFAPPFTVKFTLEGVSDMLFHRWNNEEVEAKATAKKGSKKKKTDNVESYVYRNDKGVICLPANYVRMSMVEAGRYFQDPRSPRKMAKDLFKASIVPIELLAPITTVTDNVADTWDYLDKQRVTIQRAGITRVRPAFLKGWRATFVFQSLQPEYLDEQMFHQALALAGRTVGLADYRPTYGRFLVQHFEVLTEAS